METKFKIKYSNSAWEKKQSLKEINKTCLNILSACLLTGQILEEHIQTDLHLQVAAIENILFRVRAVTNDYYHYQLLSRFNNYNKYLVYKISEKCLLKTSHTPRMSLQISPFV